MVSLIKRILVFILVVNLLVLPVIAEEPVKLIANIQGGFSTDAEVSEIYFKTIKKITIAPGVTIPQRSIIASEVLQSQKERRWHKSGFIVCKLKSYLVELTQTPVDISDKDLYFIIRKYEPINKKEATILATEIVLAQGASFFAPGVDILYFFTKGAIQREKNPNWFKAGVSNAYDNSICWFWLKGKPIELTENDLIQVKEINEYKAAKLKSQIDIRKMKKNLKDSKKQGKKELKELKKQRL